MFGPLSTIMFINIIYKGRCALVWKTKTYPGDALAWLSQWSDLLPLRPDSPACAPFLPLSTPFPIIIEGVVHKKFWSAKEMTHTKAIAFACHALFAGHFCNLHCRNDATTYVACEYLRFTFLMTLR